MSKRLTRRQRLKRKTRFRLAASPTLDLDFARAYLTSQQARDPFMPEGTAVPARLHMAVAVALSKNRDGTVNDDRMRHLLEYISDRSAPVPGLPQQESGSHALLSRLLARIETAYTRMGASPLPETVVGTLGTSDWNAFSAHFEQATALVVVHGPALVFYHLLAKAIAQAVVTITEEGGAALGELPPRDQALLAARRLAELARALSEARDPAAAPSYVPPGDWPFWRFANLLCEGIELFVVAHEYAHLMEAHGRPGVFVVPPAQGEHLESMRAELAADAAALLSLIALPDHEAPELTLLGPMVLMIFLDLMTEEGLLPAPVEHPSAAERLNLLRVALRSYPGNRSAKALLRNIVGVSQTVETTLRSVWSLAREHFGFKSEGCPTSG
jgi:hypothetical protein